MTWKWLRYHCRVLVEHFLLVCVSRGSSRYCARSKYLEQVLCTFEVSRFHRLVRSISCSLILEGVSGLCTPEVVNCAGARVSSGVAEGAGYVHVHVHVQMEVQVQV